MAEDQKKKLQKKPWKTTLERLGKRSPEIRLKKRKTLPKKKTPKWIPCWKRMFFAKKHYPKQNTGLKW
jgi:hypothetical protein